MRISHLDWVTDEIKQDFGRTFRKRQRVSRSDWDAFWAKYNLTPEQVHEMRLRFLENCGGYIGEDSEETTKAFVPVVHTCPNCGVEMKEMK